MRTKPASRCRGLTLGETLIVVFVLAVLIVMLLPVLANRYSRSPTVNCVNNLKQVGLSFRQWALDNNDKYPAQVSITNGGAKEWALEGIAWPVFQVMSNELNSPRILICPTDLRFSNNPGFAWNLANSNLSYFVALDADESQPQMFLTGDSNLEIGGGPVRSGLVSLLTNRPVSWSAARHQHQGNVGLSDGSVQGYTTARLRAALTNTWNWENRIVVP